MASAAAARKTVPQRAGGAAMSHADEAVATLLSRDNNVRDRHYKRIRLLIVVAGLTAVSVTFNTYMALKPVIIPEYWSNSDGEMGDLIVLDRPLDTTEFVRNWVTSAVTESFTFSFVDYEKKLLTAKRNFTDEGWDSFWSALRSSQVVDNVVVDKLEVRAVPRGATVMVGEPALVGNRYQYEFQIPLLLTYNAASDHNTQMLMATVKVDRLPPYMNARGLGISSVIAR